MADCHIGGWRDPRMRELSIESFHIAIDTSIKKNVDFVLIAGDLFNTAIPDIDSIKEVVSSLTTLKNKGIPCYFIAGSHDFSPSGKTMLDVLEEAGLFINVVKGEVDENRLKLNFTVDQKTGAKITGMVGKKGMLERSFYEALDRTNLEQEQGYKIFMFHTALTELKPKDMEKMDSAPVSYLPKGFDYYAGGHVHIIKHINLEGYSNITYPGALFPANFKELEEFGTGGLYIVEKGNVEWHRIEVMKTFPIRLDCNHKTPQYIEEELKHSIKDRDFTDTIITIRLKGCMSSGKVSDINFSEIIGMLHEQGAYFVMKNTNALTNQAFEEIKVNASNTDEVESTIVDEHLGQISIDGMTPIMEKELTTRLIEELDMEKQEGEKTNEFEERVRMTIKNIFEN